MALMRFAVSLSVSFLLVLIILSVAGRYIPVLRRLGGKAKAAFMFISLAAGWAYAFSMLKSDAESAASELKGREEISVTKASYFFEYARAVRMLGGTLSPLMKEQTRRLAGDKDPCRSAAALELLDEDARAAMESCSAVRTK